MLPLLPLVSASLAGSAYLAEDRFTVADKATIRLHYVVGSEGLDAGDGIRIRDPEFHGVRWSLWGRDVLDASQCTPPRDDEDPSVSLLTARTDGDATVALTRSVDETGGSSSEEAWTEVRVDAGSLAPGDEIVVVYGDTSQGADCGHEMPDRAFHGVELETWEDTGSGWSELTESPALEIEALDAVATLHVVAPSMVAAGERATLKVAPLDAYGNAVEQWTGTVTVDEAYGGAVHTFSRADAGFHDFEVTFDGVGTVHRVTVTSGDLTGTSNPVRVYDPAAPPSVVPWWGDIHVHFGHSYWKDGQYVDENVVYARDIAGLDFSAESLKVDPVSLDAETLWEELKENCVGNTVDGEFVSLLGFEWMGNLVGKDNGHHNFYMDTCDVDRPSHYDATRFPEGIDGFGSGRGPYEWAAEREAEGTQVVVVPHAPLYTGFNWGAEARDDHYRRAAEVYSEWGFAMQPPNRAGSIPDGLRSGNRMGFIAASDNHVGWMGNPYSVKTVPSGLAAF